MSKVLLEVKDVYVNVEEKEILKGLSLSLNEGETHVIMGPNGAGKSTLGHTLMANPKYTLRSGSIFFDGNDITNEPTDKRAKAGIMLTFQDPIPVPGITLGNFVRSAIEQRTGKRIRIWDFKKSMKGTLDLLNMDESYTERDLNVGFSGGEKKKAEIFQLLMLSPKLAILDETDSGLDVDAVKTVGAGIRAFKEQGGTLLIITHSTRLLDSLDVDKTHILADGKIITTGDRSLVDEVNTNGFESFIG